MLYIWYLTCVQQLRFPNSQESHKFKDPSNVLTATINAAVLVSSLWMTLCVCVSVWDGDGQAPELVASVCSYACRASSM